MVTYSANFPEALETRSKEWFFKNLTQLPLMFPMLFNRRPSTLAFEDRIRAAGLGVFQEKPEGTPVAFDDPLEGTRVRSTHAVYTLGYRVTWEAVEDDQWNILSQMPGDLGDAMRDHMESIAWSLMNDAFTGAQFTGLDALSLFNTAHTTLRPGVGTQSNSLSPAIDMSETGLQAAINVFRGMQSEEGRQLNVTPKKMVFHQNLQFASYVLLDTQYKPSSSDNDMNSVASSRSGITPLDSGGVPYLTSQTAWSLHGDVTGKNALIWYDRARPFFERGRDALSMDQLHWAGYRAHPAIGEWRTHVGSNFA